MHLTEPDQLITSKIDVLLHLASGECRHIMYKLFRVKVDKEYEVQVPNGLSYRHWPLKSLHLELA